MADTVYYSDGSLQVTDREIITPKRTYYLEQVKAASIQQLSLGILYTKWGQFWYFWSLYIAARESIRDADPWRFKVEFEGGSLGVDIGPFVALLFFIVILKGYQIYKMFFAKVGYLYVARLSGSSGVTPVAAASLRNSHVLKVVEAVNAAIHRSRPPVEDKLDEREFNSDVVTFTEATRGEIGRYVWVDGKVYKTSEIKSVEKESMTTHPYGIWLSLASDAATFVIFLVLVWTRAVPRDVLIGYFVVAFALLTPSMLTSAYFRLRRWPSVYLVKLKFKKTTKYIFVSLDEGRVQNVKDTISASLPSGPRNGYIDDSQVQIDDARARFGRRTFALDEISLVDVRVIRKRNEREFRFGATALLGSVLSLSAGYFLAAQAGNSWGYILMGLSAFLLLAAVALLIMARQVTFILTLQGRFGEVEAYTSHSELYVRKIAATLRYILWRRSASTETFVS